VATDRPSDRYQPDPTTPSLWRVARRRWRIVGATALATTILGGIVLASLPHHVQAATQVIVQPVPQGSGLTPTGDVRQPLPPDMPTEATLAAGSLIRDAARANLSTPAEQLALGTASVTIVGDSQVLRFVAHAKHADDAKAAVAALATAYLDNRTATANASVDSQNKALAKQRASVQNAVRADELAVTNSAPGSRARQAANVKLSTDIAARSQLDNQLDSLRTISVNPGQVIEKAHVTPAGTPPVEVLAIAALFGLFAGLGLALLRERTDSRLLEADDLTADPELPLLAVLPPAETGRRVDPDGPGSEAFRQLRNQIFLGQDAPAVLAVSRVEPDTLTSDVTAHLAALLARSGRRVCVIDTDSTGQGIEELIRGLDHVAIVDAQTVERGMPASSVHVISQRSGMSEANLSDLLASPLFAQLVDVSRLQAEIVIIDAPSTLSAGGQAAAVTADAVLLVAVRRKSDRRDLLHARDALQRLGKRVVGVALRDLEQRRRVPVRPIPRVPLPAGARPLPAGGNGAATDSDSGVESATPMATPTPKPEPIGERAPAASAPPVSVPAAAWTDTAVEDAIPMPAGAAAGPGPLLGSVKARHPEHGDTEAPAGSEPAPERSAAASVEANGRRSAGLGWPHANGAGRHALPARASTPTGWPDPPATGRDGQ
jgi:Mrp family chromosome partitioning ATPase